MDPWAVLLEAGRSAAAWDAFIDRYRRVIFAAIRHLTMQPDEVMDIFAQVCDALHRDDMARLRRYSSAGTGRARLSTWLVTVVHHLAVDWFRHRDGRDQAAIPASLTDRQGEIYRGVFLEQRPHQEMFGVLTSRGEPRLQYHEFVQDLRAAQRAFNASRSRSRLRTEVSPLALDGIAAADSPDLDLAETQRQLRLLLAPLEADEKLAIRLFVMHGLPAAEVARLVGWPDAKAVYNRVYRILKLLRRELGDRGIGPADL